MIKMLTEEHDATKQATLREMTAASPEPQNKGKGKSDSSRRRTKGKGKNTKAKGKGKNDTTSSWRNDRPKGKGKNRQNTFHPTHWQVNWNGPANGWENRQTGPESASTQQTTDEQAVTTSVKVKKG